MRLSPWLAPLTVPRSRLADKVVRRKVTRRETANRLSQMTERLETRTLLAGFSVDSFFDTVDVNPGDGVALDANGQTSLRAAIMEANALPGFDEILLDGGQFNLTLEGIDENAAATGDLDITDSSGVRISGFSGSLTQMMIIDAQNIDRVFEVLPGAFLQLDDVEIRGGDLRGRGDGGAIRVNSGGTLDATNVAIIENRASNGGGISNNGGSVTLTGSVVANNQAEGGAGFSQGGGIESNGGTVTIQESTIHDNRAQSVGGGIAINDGMLGDGMLIVTNSTIAQNSAGDAQMGSGDGGGIYIQTGVNATLLASTVAFNSAGNEGGGIWVNGTLTIERTLLSNNMTNSGSGPEGFFSGGMLTSNGHNLVREDTNFNFDPATGDLIGTLAIPIDPNLLGLAGNGSSTPTIAFGGASPAIDAGPMFASPLFQDQRGFSRERDGDRNGSVFTDIGAFEVQSPSDFFVEDDPADFLITNDQGSIGTLDAGDTVTFDPGGTNIAGLIFGERAFTTINDAMIAARASFAARFADGDALNEVVLGPGTYFESVLLDVPDLLFRGHSGMSSDTVINAGTATFGLQVTASGVQLDSLRVTNAVTGVNVDTPGVFEFQASNIQVDRNTGDGVHVVGGLSEFLQLQIRNSLFTGNGGDGLNVSNTESVELRNVSATLNTGDGISISGGFETALDTVTVDQNSDRGFNFQNVGPLRLRDPRTSANTNGNLFSNVFPVLLEPVVGDVSNSVIVTGSEIQFDAGFGASQQDISLLNVSAIFVSGDGGDDTITVDYSAGNPPPSRQLFLDGGPGTDQISTTNNTDHQLTDHVLSIAAVDEVNILSFEQASITGGASNNKLDATHFEGQVTLSGLGGNDTLEGTAGDDVLNGGIGNDVLLGGPLDDQYVIGDTTFEALDLVPGSGVVTILDETDTDIATVNLGTDFFRFNDVQYGGDSLFVSPSGLISFNGPVFPQNNFDLTNVAEAVSSIPIIAPLFDDWVTGIPGLTLPDAKVLIKFEDTGGAAGNERLIVEWNEVLHRDQIDTVSAPFVIPDSSPVTFQLILELNTFDRDGDITFNYVDLDTGSGFPELANGGSATVGGKDGGDNPLGVRQLSFNQQTSFVGDSKAVRARVGLSDGDDQLNGDAGDDVLVTSSGRDSLDGGSSVETAVGDRLVFDGLRNPFASDHLVRNFVIESKIFDETGRSNEFTAEYINFEALELGFGPADQNITVDPDGLPSSVSIDTRGPSASDTVTIIGTAEVTSSAVGLFDGNYSGSYVGNFLIGGMPGTIPGTMFPDNDVIAAITEGLVAVSAPDPGEGTIDAGGNISFTTLSGDGYEVGFSGTLEELEGTIFGSGTWNIIEPNGLGLSGSGTWNVARDSGAPVVSDGVDNFVLSGTTLSVGNTTIDLAGVEDLILDLSGGGADTVSVDQTFSGSARQIQVFGDAADDTVSLQSTNKPQFANLFDSAGYIANLQENLAGDLILDEVLVNGGGDGSGNSIVNQLDPDQLIVSPDGTRVYVAAANSNSLVVYDRDRVTGDLTFVESLVDGGMDFQGGTITGLSGIGFPSNVIVSADGRNVYVTSEGDQTIAFFVHHPGDTQLTFISSTILDDNGSVFNIDLPFGMAFTPEESVLIVTSEIGDLVAFLEVTSSGELVAKGVLTDGGVDSSGSTIIDGLGGASSIAVSPDGQHLYVTGATDDSIAVFSQPELDRGENDDFVLPLFLQSLTLPSLDGASSVVVSSDGRHVYVTGETSNAISVFSRDAVTGLLSFVESVTDAGMQGPTSASMSPDGFKVYIAASVSNAIAVFNRNVADGRLTLSELLVNGAADGAGTTVTGLSNVSGVFASLDGQHVYGSGSGDNAVVRFNVPRSLNVLTDGAAAISVTTSVANDQIFLGIQGQPAVVSIDAGGSADVDTVDVLGTGADDTVNVNGGVLTFGSTTLTVTSTTALNVVTDAGNDLVTVTASMTGPQLFVDGGAQTTGDVLNVDPQSAMATDNGEQVTFSGGFQSVGYADIETVVIQTAPTPVISSSDSDPTNSAMIPVSVDFGEPVTGFDQGDLSVSGGTISNFADGGGGVFTFDVTPSGDGTITVDIAELVAEDLSGNDNLVATQFSIVSDRTAPTPVISSSDSDPTNSATIPVNVTFGESMTGFDQGDLSVSGGTISNFADGGGGVFTFDVTPSGDGTITV
ncbi:MAG: 6-phosphogluconolactonase (cycloisomerase 2 family), partial [Planctomycetaceae bacterium]